MARLTLDELRALRAQYGSDEAVIAAHPELADAVLEWRRQAAQISEYARRVRQMFNAVTGITGLDPAPMLSTTEAEIGIVAAGVAEALQAQEQPTKRTPGVKPTPVSKGTKRRIAELRLGGASIATIQKETGLSKTVATRLVREVDHVLGELRAGRY